MGKTALLIIDAIACNYPTVLVDDVVGAASEEVYRVHVRDIENIGMRIVRAADIPGLLGESCRNNELIKKTGRTLIRSRYRFPTLR